VQRIKSCRRKLHRPKKLTLACFWSAVHCPVAVTLHTVLPTSSAISKAPVLSIATPTGRPRASPFALKKPVTTNVVIESQGAEDVAKEETRFWKRRASSLQRSGLPSRSRFLRLPPESTRPAFLWLHHWGLSNRIVEHFRLGPQPILVRVRASCGPNVICALTNTKHQSLIHRNTSQV
jgi:hypothetical protein